MNLSEEIRAAWIAGRSMNDVLSRFVVETNSRAAGCWRLREGHLRLMGFGWASDMPFEVCEGFQVATRDVSLQQQGLGIVKAAVTLQPAVGRRDPSDTGLAGSANWIAKFAANSSLAVPICDATTRSFLGVLAVSSTEHIGEGSPLWRRMVELAIRLGESTN